MDFREYAAKEASDLVARLTKAAATAAEAAVRQAKEDAQKVADGLRTELKAAVDGRTAAAAALKEAQAQGERLRGELKTASERIEVATRQLEDARRTAEKLEASRAEVSAARDEQAAARKTAETELRAARTTIESLRGEIASAMQTLEKAAAERLASEETAAAANSHSEAAEAKLTAVTELLKKSAARVRTLEQAQQEFERKLRDLEAKRREDHAAAPAASSAAALDDLLTGVQALAACTTIADVLTTLVEQMACQFPRVALFRLKKGHLQGEHQIGFDLKTDVGKLVLPLGMDSLPARAASSGQIESLVGDDLKTSRTPFTGTPSCALALPLAVGAETLAVVYADDCGAPARGRGHGHDLPMRYAEAMRQYAVAVLMRLSNELKTLAELQKYAVSLLHEIEQMYGADVENGLAGEDLEKRLAGNLDYARSIFGSRTALESADAATLIDEELAALVESRKGTPFARDLAVAAGHTPARSAAEAS